MRCPFCGNGDFEDEIWEEFGGEPRNQCMVDHTVEYRPIWRNGPGKVEEIHHYLVRRFCKECGACGPWAEHEDEREARLEADLNWDTRVL